MTKKYYSIILLLIFLLTSCSGNGGGDSKSTIVDTKIISGLISDPPIMQARVELRDDTDEILFKCGEGGNEVCISKSDADGNFVFKIDSGYFDKVSYIKSDGGTDSKTGKDFEGIAFIADFSSQNSKTIISPLTTIIFWMIKERGLSKDESSIIISSWMNLDPSISPINDPELEKSLLKANILSGFMDSFSKDEDIFKKIAMTATINNPLIQQNSLDQEVLNKILPIKEDRDNLQFLFDDIDSASNVDEVILRSKSFFIASHFKGAIEKLIKNDDPYYQDHSQFIEANSKFLSKKLLNKNILLNDNYTQQLIRYLFNKYKLIEVEKNNDTYSFKGPFLERRIDDADITQEGLNLSSDENIEKILDTSTIYQVKTPLLENEIPGNDNEKRMHYYYNSDISHLYLASKTIESVFDDDKRDEILQKIAKGYGDSGFFEKALTITDTQINTKFYQGLSYLEIGNSKKRDSDNRGALQLVKKAEDIFWEIMETKGYNLFDVNDSYYIHRLLLAYINLGNLNSATSIMDRVDKNIIPEIKEDDTIFFRIISSLYISISPYLSDKEQIEENAILSLTDLLYKYSINCPPNESKNAKYYKMKVFALTNTAIFYAILNKEEKVFEIGDMVDSIRENDNLYSDEPVDGNHYQNLTKEKTWVYMKNMIRAFGFLGDNQQAEIRANLIVNTFPKGSTYEADGYSALASVKARLNKVDDAMEIVKTDISASGLDKTLVKRIEALTYKSSSTPKIAEIAIENNSIADACKAIDLALIYTDIIYNDGSDINKNIYKIKKGYLKIAQLLHKINDDDFAKEIFSKIEIVLNGGTLENISTLDDNYNIVVDSNNNPNKISIELDAMTGNTYYINAAVDSALKANELGFYQLAQKFAEYAKTKAADAAYDTSIKPDKRADYLIDVIYTYIELNKGDDAKNLIDLSLNIIDQIANQNQADEDDYIDESKAYIELADVLTKTNFLDDIKNVLNLATVLKDKVLKISDKTDLISKISKVYAKTDLVDKAIEVANEIEFSHERFNLLSDIAKLYANKDDFPNIKEAMIDIDGDGKPYFLRGVDQDRLDDFFLKLDTDSDNDGNLDINDKTPLYNN